MLENLTEIQEILLLQDQIQEEERTLRKRSAGWTSINLIGAFI